MVLYNNYISPINRMSQVLKHQVRTQAGIAIFVVPETWSPCCNCSLIEEAPLGSGIQTMLSHDKNGFIEHTEAYILAQNVTLFDTVLLTALFKYK